MAAPDAAALPPAAAKLLDFGQPMDVELLDATVAAFYGASSNEERAAAEAVLKAVQAHPAAWSRVDAVLERSTSQQSKFFALQILEEVIKYRWGALPDDQRAGVRNFVSNLIIARAADAATARRERVFLAKLDAVLVHILKQDWPHAWPSFIPDLCAASRTSESLCENSMLILKLLSEEVFDFSRGELTQAKARDLKSSLNAQFGAVHDLCTFALTAAAGSPSLARATLDTLHAYLSWVPLAYVFESDVVATLLRLFPQPPFRNAALRCLTEVAALSVGPEHDAAFVSLLTVFMGALATILPPGTDVAAAYAAGSADDQDFVQGLALFLTTFLRAHLPAVEAAGDAARGPLLAALDVLVSASFAPDDEILKICLDYWNAFVPGVYASVTAAAAGAAGAAGGASGAAAVDGRALYARILSRLRTLCIERMAKPEEVIVVEDDAGNIVREAMKDTDTLARYKSMHETLVYLAHLDHDDTEAQMQAKLRAQAGAGARGGDWSWSSLNTLCWAVGSISGSMAEDQENRFLVTVIRDLLNLCEVTRGKDNKAVIAANIMYVVGQYPRFLRNHWKFLKTVVNKLFEFMHETHPGVQDMACETFLKICHKCRRKFVVTQLGEAEPFVCELLGGLAATIQDLEAHQVHMFYEAVGLIIGADADPARRAAYLDRLMAPPNATWDAVVAAAAADPASLTQAAVIKNVTNILQTNASVCSSLGAPYAPQMERVFGDVLRVYSAYAAAVRDAVAGGGPHAARTAAVKGMRGVKRAALKLIEAFVERCDDAAALATRYAPPLADAVLADYAASSPDARDAEPLALYAALVGRLRDAAAPLVPAVFDATFTPTLAMITANFEDFPDHRLAFFALLRAVASACPAPLFALDAAAVKLLVDAVVWAFRHTERNVADVGLHLLLDLLTAFERSPVAAQFYQAYYMHIVREVFAVMTDTFHKPGFKLHARILHHLFALARADSGAGLAAPLWEGGAPGAHPSNAAYVTGAVTALLASSFPNLRPGTVDAAVGGMLALREFGPFKEHLRDFLVQTKQFASQDNADLFAEEAARAAAAEAERLAAIPGMVAPPTGGGE